MKKCLVLLSGGIDSAVTLWWGWKKGWKLATLSFTFPGRRRKELLATRRLRRLAGARENFEVPLSFIDPPRPDRACYIPQRNLMYYGIAASLADKIGADVILGGHIRHDGKVFQDAEKKYLSRIEGLARNNSNGGRKVRMIFPFIEFDKKDIIQAGSSLKIPFGATWSCSRDGIVHCWNCNSCRERMSGFDAAGVRDPLYAPFLPRSSL